MKKIFGILMLVFLSVFGMKPWATAQNNVQMQMNMFKDVSSNGETTYGTSFDVSNDVLKNVVRVFVEGPAGRRIWVNNTLNLNGILLSATNLSSEQFNHWFPEGGYRILLSPPVFGKLVINMTHNFPSTPAVLYPLDGSSGVPTNPIILWAPMTGIDSLRLQLKSDAGFSLGIDLPTNAISYRVPEGLLSPNTQYDLSLGAKKAVDSGGNGLVTTTLSSFTTGQ